MSAKQKLQRQLADLEALVGGGVDCILEARNNVTRSEWDFGESNLRKLFGNAQTIAKQREATLRLLRLATKTTE